MDEGASEDAHNVFQGSMAGRFFKHQACLPYFENTYFIGQSEIPNGTRVTTPETPQGKPEK
jgi:hypothetical protein